MSVEKRRIPGFPGYAATAEGEIVSLASGLPLRGHANHGGYLHVVVGSRSNGTRTRESVHRLVALAWHGRCPAGQEVRHLNDIKTDNRPANLTYGVHSENMRDAYRNGRLASGPLHKDSVIDGDRVAVIRACRSAGVPATRIAGALRISDVTVRKVAVGEHWSASHPASTHGRRAHSHNLNHSVPLRDAQGDLFAIVEPAA